MLSQKAITQLEFALKKALTFVERGERDKAIGAIEQAIAAIDADGERYGYKSAEDIEWRTH